MSVFNIHLVLTGDNSSLTATLTVDGGGGP